MVITDGLAQVTRYSSFP